MFCWGNDKYMEVELVQEASEEELQLAPGREQQKVLRAAQVFGVARP